MSGLDIYLLGPPRFERNGKSLEIDTRKTIALMAYLAVTGRAHSREALVTLLWPEAEPRQGRAILRRNLSVLNKTLGGTGLAVARDAISLDPEADIIVDVDQFQQLAQTGSDASRLTHDLPPESALPGELARASALVHFSDREATAVTPLEAFSFGLPVVANSLPAFQEALGDEAALLPLDELRDDPSCLADALAHALEHGGAPDARRRREAIAARFTWEAHAKAALAIWRAALSALANFRNIARVSTGAATPSPSSCCAMYSGNGRPSTSSMTMKKRPSGVTSIASCLTTLGWSNSPAAVIAQR